MRWKLFATLAEAVGETEVAVDTESATPTLREALDALVASHPELRAEILDSDGSLKEHIKLLCDGEDPFHRGDGWETDLSDVDECALFPPVSGG